MGERCGTYAGAQQHRRRRVRRRLPADQVTPCPSEAAYRRHRRNGEPTEDCGCLAAHAEYERTRWQRARGVAA